MSGFLAMKLVDEDNHIRQEIYTGLTVLQHRGQGKIIEIKYY